MKRLIRKALICLWLTALGVAQEQAATGNTKAVGTVQSISGNSLTLKTDAGSEITISAQDGARILRSEPGQKSLKEASAIQFSEIQTGDRTLASGKASADGKTIAATTIVVMKQGDIASKQEKERQDWQRRGVGGLVSKVDAASNSITISTMSGLQKKDVTVHVSPGTVIRRYSPDSVKFDDATKSALAEVKSGDQLRARGEKNADGSEITAEEIVSGSFRSIAGTVQSVDKDKNQITLMNLATKKPVTITVGADSQMRKLPEMMAQHIAMRLKGGGAEAAAGAPQTTNAQAVPPAGGTGGGQGNWRGGQGGNGGGMRAGGGADMLQMVLQRAPAVQITDLQKGDAVMLVATEGSSSSAPTVITLLSGVEPILTASPKGSDASTILSPWNLGGGGAADAAAAQ
jgi:hypothetical protein